MTPRTNELSGNPNLCASCASLWQEETNVPQPAGAEPAAQPREQMTQHETDIENPATQVGPAEKVI